MAKNLVKGANSHLGKQKRRNNYQSKSKPEVVGQKKKDTRIEIIFYVKSSIRAISH